MEYSDFYDIATYLNEINRNVFTQKEVACNAADYYADFQWSKENDDIAHNIKELAKLLAEDGDEECHDWLYEMTKELGLFDMDYLDYSETDESLLQRYISEEKPYPAIVKIRTAEGSQTFFMHINQNESSDLQVHKALAEICFCDDYEIVRIDSINEDYVKERERLCEEFQNLFSESIEEAFPSGKYTTASAINEEKRWRLKQKQSPKM